MDLLSLTGIEEFATRQLLTKTRGFFPQSKSQISRLKHPRLVAYWRAFRELSTWQELSFELLTENDWLKGSKFHFSVLMRMNIEGVPNPSQKLD